MEPDGVLHRIDEDLADDWVERLAGDGVAAIESYLAKHLAFLTYLEDEA
jgi:hypothetical protein